MFLVPSLPGLFKWRQFEPEVILLAVGWYLRFSLSYRDVEELLAERGIAVDHVTLWRVLVQIFLSVCFCRARGFGDFMPPAPRPRFPERWLRCWLLL
jgi:hypothetical protein